MRVLERDFFTIPALVQITPGSTEDNTRKFLIWLVRHGYVAKIGNGGGGRLGNHQKYKLLSSDFTYPVVCSKCSQPISAKVCEPPFLKREREKEREEEKQTGGEP
jgi:hypothetical protein